MYTILSQIWHILRAKRGKVVLSFKIDMPSNFARLTKRIQNKLRRVWLIKKKRLMQSLAANNAAPKKILFIVGCQRSGTTMMLRILERDRQSRVYGEFSELSLGPNRTLLKPFAEVRKLIDRDPAPFVVVKPLVETQRLPELFEHFPEAKALWMYRHYKDVVSSNLKNFGEGNGVDDLRPIAQRDPANWRSSHASEEVQQIARRFFSEEMSPFDAAALFWYARNSLYFDMDLPNHPRVMISRYNDIVLDPRTKLSEIYRFVDRPFPDDIIRHDIQASSVGKGKAVDLTPEIEELCQQMLARLDQAYQASKSAESDSVL